jgi:hypothetical protein
VISSATSSGIASASVHIGQKTISAPCGAEMAGGERDDFRIRRSAAAAADRNALGTLYVVPTFLDRLDSDSPAHFPDESC